MSCHNALALQNNRKQITNCGPEEHLKIKYKGAIGSHVFSTSPTVQASVSDTLELLWSKEGTISAHLSRQNSETQEISAKWIRGIPFDVQSNSAQVSSFLKSAYVSLKPVVGTNDFWVNIYSRLLGGMGPKKNQDKTGLQNLKTPNIQLVQPYHSPAAFAPQANQFSVRLNDEHFTELTTYLESLANPLLSLNIIEFLKNMCQESSIIHPERGLNLSDCVFPEDTIAALQQFNLSLIDAFKQLPRNPNEMAQFNHHFKSDMNKKLESISESLQKKEKQLWKDLATFMRTPEIQRLSNDSVLQFLKLIDTHEAQELRSALVEILKNEKIEEKSLEISVQEIDEDVGDLLTLCSEIIENKPRNIPFSKRLENAPLDSFNKLQLVLKKDGADSILGEIINFKKNSNRSYEFELAADEEQSSFSKICIKSDFTVTKINSYTCGLQTVLLNTGLQDGKVFRISSQELGQKIQG